MSRPEDHILETENDPLAGTLPPDRGSGKEEERDSFDNSSLTGGLFSDKFIEKYIMIIHDYLHDLFPIYYFMRAIISAVMIFNGLLITVWLAWRFTHPIIDWIDSSMTIMRKLYILSGMFGTIFIIIILSCIFRCYKKNKKKKSNESGSEKDINQD